MNKGFLFLSLIILFTAQIYAQDISSENDILGVWYIKDIMKINGTKNIYLEKDPNVIFTFCKSGIGQVENVRNRESINISWECNYADKTISVISDEYKMEGRFSIEANTLIFVVIQNDSEVYVIIMRKDIENEQSVPVEESL